MGPSSILVVTDGPERCESMLGLLRCRWRCPVLTDDVNQATDLVRNGSLDLIVLNGCQKFCQPFLGVFGELHARLAFPPFIIIAVESSEAFAIASLRSGATDYLPVPVELATLAESISRCVPEYRMPSAEPDLAGGEVLVGSSPVMQLLRTQIRRVAATDFNVLITGETGTGKELVAQLIHQNSPRKANPLICLNCAAIPDSLLESELFGYERGAFTGATCTNQGKLMAANRGTVFFDEIGDMSPLAQAKVLRAIETKEVQRLGATRKCDTDIRILGATHHNVDDLANAEHFRRDLYFRLNVGRIYLPPLRERKIDIAALVERMIIDLNKRLGRYVEGITSAAIRSLSQYDWPGNVRELKNLVERVFISLERGRIGVEHVAGVLPKQPQAISANDKEIYSLHEALAMCNGNKSKAAERLNWSRMTLYRKLARYKLQI